MTVEMISLVSRRKNYMAKGDSKLHPLDLQSGMSLTKQIVVKLQQTTFNILNFSLLFFRENKT